MALPKNPFRAEKRSENYPSVETQSEVQGNQPERAETQPRFKTTPAETDILSKPTPVIKPRPAPTSAPEATDPVVTEIKTVLGKDLGPTYYKMTSVQQHQFLVEEEKTALKIKQLLATGHAQTKKIFKLIFDWLKLIPGVNKFFIKQEAKIKTERIINLDKKR